MTKLIIVGGFQGLHESAGYIYKKQLEDAGIILIGKSDLLDAESCQRLLTKTKGAYQNAVVHAISSKNEIGVDDWLNEMIEKWIGTNGFAP